MLIAFISSISAAYLGDIALTEDDILQIGGHIALPSSSSSTFSSAIFESNRKSDISKLAANMRRAAGAAVEDDGRSPLPTGQKRQESGRDARRRRRRRKQESRPTGNGNRTDRIEKTPSASDDDDIVRDRRDRKRKLQLEGVRRRDDEGERRERFDFVLNDFAHISHKSPTRIFFSHL